MNPDVAFVERVLTGAQSLPAAFDTSAIACALGMGLEHLSKESGEAKVSFAPDETFIQGTGVLQGGAVAAMLDYAMILSVMAVMPKGSMPATANLDTVYYRPARPGRYEARAEVRRKTRSAIFAQASLYSDTGDEVASATTTAIIRTPAPAEAGGAAE